jgi:hypothetical protein
MELKDWWALLHPALAIVLVFPLLGIVLNFSWQVRQRRLQTGKNKIPATVGPEHVQFGKLLSGSVVAITLLGLVYPIASKMFAAQTWLQDPFRVGFVGVIGVATIASLVFLYQARQRLWRAVFATLTGMGLIILGSQPEVFRRDFEWYASHYYGGIVVALLMIFSLAIVQDIYQDRQNRWRTVHIVLNSIAVLFFLAQGVTGTRDLLEIPLSWQKPYVEQLYKQTCRQQPCQIQPAVPAPQP